jgi:hypothetical protein
VADGTAVSRRHALDHFAAITGIITPEEADLLSPTAAGNDVRFPGTAYVSALDQDGNEVAGIRHPELSVPLATHTGWNLVLAEGAQWASFGSVTGNSVPFPQRAPAAMSRDRRRNIRERYRDLDDYVTQIEAAAELLAAEGFLLAEDVEGIVLAGRTHFELIAGLQGSTAERA